MNTQTVTIKLPRNLLSCASDVAQRQDVTIGDLVRNLLSKEVDRQLNPKTPFRTDGRLVAALQALLVTEMASAEGWKDFASRLAEVGYEMRPAGSGLTMHKRICGTCMCKLSELGFPYSALVKRFRCGMPDHPHGALNLVFDVLPPIQASLPLEGDAAFEVINFTA